MSEQSTETTNENAADELTLLKERAKLLGVTVGGNIGIETLRQRINAKIAGETSPDEETKETAAPEKAAAVERPKSKAEIEQEVRDTLRKDALALVRCRIYNLNPSKRDLQGEIITVANRYVGTVRKFIPFGEATDNGYHIPKILFDDLKARRFQSIQTVQKDGQIQVKTRMAPEYNLEVLPQLTPDELRDLAINQAAAERVGE